MIKYKIFHLMKIDHKNISFQILVIKESIVSLKEYLRCIISVRELYLLINDQSGLSYLMIRTMIK